MTYLMVFFAVLSLVFGIWGFVIPDSTWAPAEWLFWFCLGVLILLLCFCLYGWSQRSRRPTLQ